MVGWWFNDRYPHDCQVVVVDGGSWRAGCGTRSFEVARQVKFGQHLEEGGASCQTSEWYVPTVGTFRYLKVGSLSRREFV